MANLNEVLLFALTSNKGLTKKVADELGIEVAPSIVSHFADGETFAKPACDVKDKICYVIQSTGKPVDDNLFELFIFIDALKNGGAKSVNIVIPYFGYSRQDRIINDADPVTTRLVSRLFETAGADRVISLDLHSDKMETFFNIKVKNLFPSELLHEYFIEKFKEFGVEEKDVVIVAPDHGSVNRARHLALLMLDAKIAYLDKRRPKPNVAVITGIVGDVENKTCIIVDDIIDTGGTICEGVKTLINHGAKQVFVAASHGVFSNEATKKLFATGIKDLVVTDSIEAQDESVSVVSIAKLVADEIRKE